MPNYLFRGEKYQKITYCNYGRIFTFRCPDHAPKGKCGGYEFICRRCYHRRWKSLCEKKTFLRQYGFSQPKKGSYVTLLAKSGAWWQVEYANDRYGYCHADYITPVEGKPVRVNTGGNVLNVRSGPGTSYNRITTIPHGAIVLLRSEANGWSRILYHGTKLGYVSSQYLTSGQTGSGVISLKVPSFKQTDSRWASYPIGTTGGTIGTIGCATTGIAMMESYRTGTTIYPHEMAKKLSYSSGGAVYWPSHYTVITSRTGYLEKIHQLLQQGKPVLLGAKTGSGGQHWVVITGFTGGNLTAENFTIQDPGSNSRINLKQFFNAYPNFYKYFYY